MQQRNRAHPSDGISATTFPEASGIAACPSSTPPRSSRGSADGQRVPKDCHTQLGFRARVSNLLYLPCLSFSPAHSQFQAFFLVSNDMMDSLIRRRGQPCWYRVSKVGQIVISDSFILEVAICYRISAGRATMFIDILEPFWRRRSRQRGAACHCSRG